MPTLLNDCAVARFQDQKQSLLIKTSSAKLKQDSY